MTAFTIPKAKPKSAIAAKASIVLPGWAGIPLVSHNIMPQKTNTNITV
jgi:hypothetical protein